MKVIPAAGVEEVGCGVMSAAMSPGRLPGLTLPLLLLLPMLLTAHVAAAADLSVRVDGVRSGRGVLRFCVFAAPAREGFPDCAGDPRPRHVTAPAAPGDVAITVPGLAPGVYAVSVYHDEANTGRLERSWLGIPRDGVGVSNNPRALLGPPSFLQAAFTLLPAGGQVVIALVYP